MNPTHLNNVKLLFILKILYFFFKWKILYLASYLVAEKLKEGGFRGRKNI